MNLTKANLVLAVATVVLAVPTWVTLRRDLENFVDVSQVPKLLEGFTADNVATLALGKPKDPQPAVPAGTDPNQKPQLQYDQINFQRTDQGFVLGQGMGDLVGVPVNNQMLELQVWKHLTDIPGDKETLVQKDATEAQLVEYGLDVEHAFVVKAGNASGQLIAELLVGKDTTTSQGGTEAVRGVFVRRADSRDVVFYEVPMWTRALDANTWIDRTLFKVPADKVRRLELQNQTGKVVLTKAAGQASWAAEAAPNGRGAVRQTEVEGLAQRLGFLQVAEFVKPLAGANLPALGLDAPKLAIAVTYEKDGKDVQITIGVGNPMDGKNSHYARCSESQFAVAVPSPWVAGFERDVGEFFDPAAPTPQETVPAPGEGQKPADADEAPKTGGDAPKETTTGGEPAPGATPETPAGGQAGQPGQGANGGGQPAPAGGTEPSAPIPAPVTPAPGQPGSGTPGGGTPDTPTGGG